MKHPKQKLLTIMISSALLMTGCGGGGVDSIISDISDNLAPANDTDTPSVGGDSENNGGGSNPAANPFSGIANIIGTIDLKALIGSDANSLDSSFGQQRNSSLWSTRASVKAADNATENAIIKLYVVSANGLLEDTGITCEFSEEKDDQGNPKYSCEGVADGQQYVIKYFKILEGDKALEMKVDITVPSGSSDVEADDVSPQSTMIADAIMNAVLEATEGKDIDPGIVDEIIASVKKIVVKLVESGAVNVPSMLVDAPKNADGEFIDDATDLSGDNEVVFGDNENLESASGTLLSDEEVSQKVDTVRVEIEVKDLSDVDTQDGDGKRKLIEKIFNRMLEGDVPGFMVDFFADRFEQDDSVNIDDLFGAVNAGLGIQPELGVDIRELELSTEGAIDSLRAALDEIYALLAKKDSPDLSPDEKKKLSEIPALIPAIFPAEQWSGENMTPETVLNIPQSIVFTIFVTDHYVQEVFEETQGRPLEDLVSVGNQDQDKAPMQVEFNNPVDFNPMFFDPAEEHPGLLQLFGFFSEEYLSSLKGVEVAHLDVHPDKIWIENFDKIQQRAGIPNGKEYDMLRANVCVSDLSVMAGLQDGDNEGRTLSVELSYPTRSGERGVVELQEERKPDFSEGGDYPDEAYPEFKGKDGEEGPQRPGPGGPGPGSEGGPNFESCFTLDPWLAAEQGQGTEGNARGYFQPSLDDIVSDFTSGKYEVQVKDSTGNVIADKTFKKKVIVGMQNAAPQFTSPNGAPQWPVECQFTDYCPQWEDIQQKWNEAGGNTTFSLNIDTTGDGLDDKAKVNLSWKKPEVDLPKGVKIAYSLNVGLNKGCDETGCGWENIYSSHERDRRLFARSLTLPTLLEKLEVADGGSYNANICAEFVDTDNGEFLGTGGCGFAEFNVGKPLDLNAEFKVVGEVPSGLGSEWKVALIGEKFRPQSRASVETSEPEITTLVVSDIDEKGRYELKQTIGDILNQSSSTNYTIRLFRDDNGDGQLSNDLEAREPQFWPHWESNFWFETWGRTLRVISETHTREGDEKRSRHEVVVVGGETIKGPDFSYLGDEDWFQRDISGKGDEPVDEYPVDDPYDVGDDASKKPDGFDTSRT